MTIFVIHGYEADDPERTFGPLKSAFERRGHRCLIVRSPETKTPNRDRAAAVVEALSGIEDDIALVGISNQGLFMPLVAAARPIKRIVFINAVIPYPGKSFQEGSKGERVFTNVWMWLLARLSPGMREVCLLRELPKVECVYVCGAEDDAIRPEWEQSAARSRLHVEPVVIEGAGHADIVLDYTEAVVDAATCMPVTHGRDRPAPTSFWHASPKQSSASIVVAHLSPLVMYFLLRPHVQSDTEALALAWLVPVLWTLGSSLRVRRLDFFGSLGIVTYGIALSISIFFGAGALPLKLHRAAITGLVGMAFLASVAIKRPILLVLARRRAESAGRIGAFSDPKLERMVSNITLLVGIGCLADCAIFTTLAIVLSTGAFMVAATIIHFVSVAVMALAVITYVLLTRRRERNA